MALGTITVRLEVKDRKVRKDLEEILSSIEGIQIARPSEDSVDLLILELGTDIEKEFQRLQSLLDLGSVGEVFLTSPNSDSRILVQGMRAGAKEFFLQPIDPQEVRQAFLRLKEQREKQKRHQRPEKEGRIIHIIGSKGGVGTTTISVNLATSLARRGPSVALIDMNPLFGEVSLFLEMEPTYHWGEIAKNINRLDATFLMNILSVHASGVHVLASPSYLNGANATPEVLARLLALMKTLFDYIVIDGGQRLDEASLKTYEMADTVLLISLLSLPSLANVSRLLKSLNGFGLPLEKSQVVINRHVKHPDLSIKEAEESLKRKIFRIIPNDYRTSVSAINHGKPLWEVARKKPVSRSIDEMAAALSQEEKVVKRRGFIWR